MQQTVTFTGYEEKKRGESKRGPWALRVFTAAGGTKFQTFDVGLGDKLIGLVGQPVEVEYEVESNGNFDNNVVRSAKAAGGSVNGAPVSAPQTSILADAAKIDRETRIMRQSALERAIATAAAGIVKVSDPHQLFAISDQYIRYFEEGSAAFKINDEDIPL